MITANISIVVGVSFLAIGLISLALALVVFKPSSPFPLFMRAVLHGDSSILRSMKYPSSFLFEITETKEHAPFMLTLLKRAPIEAVVCIFAEFKKREGAKVDKTGPGFPPRVPPLGEWLASSACVDGQGSNVLHAIAMRDDETAPYVLEQLESLLDEPARLRLVQGRSTDKGWTPLHICAARGSTATARLLLGDKWRADVNAASAHGRTPLQIAACNGFPALVALLLERHNVDLAACDSASLRTPLLLAAMNGHVDIVRQLLDAARDSTRPGAAGLLGKADVAGYTPLHAAAIAGCTEAARALLAAGADSTALTRDQETPLHSALRKNRATVVRLFIGEPSSPATARVFASLNAVTTFGSTAVHQGARRASADSLEVLLQAAGSTASGRISTDVWKLFCARDYDGLTPLHELGHAFADTRVSPAACLRCLRLFLRVAAAWFDWASAAQRACEGTPSDDDERGDIAACNTLAEWVNVKDYGDGTFLHYLACAAVPQGEPHAISDARCAAFVEAAQLVLDAGADPLCLNTQGWTPLHYLTAQRLVPGELADFIAREAFAGPGEADQIPPPPPPPPLAPLDEAAPTPPEQADVTAAQPGDAGHADAAEGATAVDVSAVEATVRAAAKALFRVMWAHLCRTAHPPQAPLSLATHISFDAHKPRDTSNTLYLQRRGPQNRIPARLRCELLGLDFTMRGVAAYMRRVCERYARGEGPPLRVVVLAGAGISTAAGIPDFRSPRSGIYTNPRTRGLAQVFNNAYMAAHPDHFACAARVFFYPVVEGSCRPTLAHRFIKTLADKGYLLRCYTQNIDGLERVVGVPEELLCEAHGTMHTARCLDPHCPNSVSRSIRGPDMAKYFWPAIARAATPEALGLVDPAPPEGDAATAANGAVPADRGGQAATLLEVKPTAAAATTSPPVELPAKSSVPSVAAPVAATSSLLPEHPVTSRPVHRGHPVPPTPSPTAAATAVTTSAGDAAPMSDSKVGTPATVPQGDYPRCPRCGGPLRPDVVFFGEGLPAAFAECSTVDMPQCNLLLVMGTSLTVYPFAGLCSQVPVMCPRVLFNLTPAGPFRDLPDARILEFTGGDQEEGVASLTEGGDGAHPAVGTRAYYEARLQAHEGNYRDVLWQGDANGGLRALATELGWDVDRCLPASAPVAVGATSDADAVIHTDSATTATPTATP